MWKHCILLIGSSGYPNPLTSRPWPHRMSSTCLSVMGSYVRTLLPWAQGKAGDKCSELRWSHEVLTCVNYMPASWTPSFIFYAANLPGPTIKDVNVNGYQSSSRLSSWQSRAQLPHPIHPIHPIHLSSAAHGILPGHSVDAHLFHQLGILFYRWGEVQVCRVRTALGHRIPGHALQMQRGAIHQDLLSWAKNGNIYTIYIYIDTIYIYIYIYI